MGTTQQGRDDLSSLFNDDLLGMDAGVGDAAAEEKAREALSNSMFADEQRGHGVHVHVGTPDRNSRGHGRDRHHEAGGGMLGGGTPQGHGDRNRGDSGNARVPGPRAIGHNNGRHDGERHGTRGGTPHRTPGRAHDRDGHRRHHDDEHGDDRDFERDGHGRDGHDDDDFDSDADDPAERPSPAELLHDTRVILQAADQALMRDGMPPSRENMERLDTELRRIVSQQRTTLQDDQKRQNLLRRFSQMLQKKFPGVSLTPFGSFVSVFHTAGSDIDVSLEVDPSSVWYDAKEMGRPDPLTSQNSKQNRNNRRNQAPRGYKSKKVQLLSKVASELRYQRFSEVNLIAHARVPLIKFKDSATGVNCDVCVGNDGVYKSAVLGTMANLDQRYRDLVFLVKMWAKRFDCNDATAGSFNSFALSLMSLFHLQTRSPPILPPVLRLTLPTPMAQDADLAHENERANNLEPIRKFPVSKIRQQSDLLRDIGPVEDRASRWLGCGSENQASLAELLVTFFTHFRCVEPLWRHGLVASTYAGQWVAGSSWAPGRYCVGVEDPFAAGDNVARAVQRRSLPKVLSAVRDGTLAMARVVWADTDEDLEKALFDLLGEGALPPREMPQSGWPTLGGAGANEELNSPQPAAPGNGMGMSPGRSPGVGAPGFEMDAFNGNPPMPPPGAPPMGLGGGGLNGGLLNLLTGGVGANRLMMPPGGNNGVKLFGGPPQGGMHMMAQDSQGMQQGMQGMQGPGPGMRGSFDGGYQQPPSAAQAFKNRNQPPGFPGPGQQFFQGPPQIEGLDRAFDRSVHLGGHGGGHPLPNGFPQTPPRPQTLGELERGSGGGIAPPGFSPPQGAMGARVGVQGGGQGMAPNGFARTHSLGGSELPSPNTSPGGEDGAVGKRRGRRGTDGAKRRGTGRLPGKPESVGPKTLPKPRVAPP